MQPLSLSLSSLFQSLSLSLPLSFPHSLSPSPSHFPPLCACVHVCVCVCVCMLSRNSSNLAVNLTAGEESELLGLVREIASIQDCVCLYLCRCVCECVCVSEECGRVCDETLWCAAVCTLSNRNFSS